eukprot:TRINITY_DN55898_c0_g1_i1.p2 TRINITY_DN55898_c0_g1~~TRINITY_DN55898_c0_g1_i1.p2  ORF type:complete len:116 (+),score=26.75 TRINITY_DN55898_c0_g1_i1:79-426(+)
MAVLTLVRCFAGVVLGMLAISFVDSAAPVAMPPEIKAMVLNTPKPVTDAQMMEFKQDFVDVDFNRDNVMDAQEVRAHFKDGISNKELYEFFLDSDTDQSGSIDLQEYVSYAALLN